MPSHRDESIIADAPPRGDLGAHAVTLVLVSEVGGQSPRRDRGLDCRVER